MSTVETGKTVRVHYKGTKTDGSQFDSSYEREEPLEFTIGLNQVIPGFESGVIGMAVGDNKKLEIPADDAYGAHSEEMVAVFPRNEIPDDIELAIGMVLTSTSPDGQTLHFSVIAFDDESVTLDGNHPLAGQDLVFDLELIEIL